MALPGGPRKGVPANSENSFYFGVVGKDRAHVRFDDTYHAAMQGTIPEDAFRTTMAAINANPDVKAWLHIVWDNHHRAGASKMLHQAGTILTCGYLNLRVLDSEISAEQKMNHAVKEIIATANSNLQAGYRWTWVVPTSVTDAYIQIEDTQTMPGHHAV